MNSLLPTLFALSQPVGNAVLFGALAALGVISCAALIFGITRWKRPLGKAVALGAGLLLLGLAAYVVVVLALIWSADHGQPM